jgi:hypothetical protein
MDSNLTAHQKAKALEALLNQQNRMKHKTGTFGDAAGDDARIVVDNGADAQRFVTGNAQARGHL